MDWVLETDKRETKKMWMCVVYGKKSEEERIVLCVRVWSTARCLGLTPPSSRFLV